MTIKEKIEVMQAAASGKLVQWRYSCTNDKWQDASAPLWNWHSCDYRVKPEPKINWFVVRNNGTQAHCVPYERKDYADQFADDCNKPGKGIGHESYRPYTVTSFEVKE